MQNYIDLNQRIAKNLLLDMVINNDDKISLECSLINELKEEPSRIFKAIDDLWDCQEIVPNLTCDIISRALEPKSLLPSVITYSVIAKEFKCIITKLFDTELVIDRNDYCIFDNHEHVHCWDCNKANNYKDCKGNDMLKILGMDGDYMRYEPESWLDLDRIGIYIGKAESGVRILCLQCSTSWGKDKEDYAYPSVDSDVDNVDADNEIIRMLENWRQDETIKWNRCPFGCNADKDTEDIAIVLKLLDLKIKCDEFESTLEELVDKVSEDTGNKNRKTIKEQLNGYFIELEKSRFACSAMLEDSKIFSEDCLYGAITWLEILDNSVKKIYLGGR